ncbi:N-acetylneuraminate 9-O-acetyltransferase isoform X6 [Nerophis ophidion]|uniref:N-acetylneuraminate 9-O-acetyltransferase isoform X6 n=1 Tax=Nerophis ophidion TaxID=159077 RepID=UPI002ADF9627|nr:N-acetylneuraminate 9-O-acetyltransferase isoform X6 [Nerophis ophidion]
MAVLAYSLGKREINQHFTIKNAKLVSLVLVILLFIFHTASRYFGGGDSCEWLLSSGRYLGENVWQPYGCMMHKYKSMEAKTCLSKKRVAFLGDSRIRQLFHSFIKVIDPGRRDGGVKHEDISFEEKSSSLYVDMLWYPEANNSMKERLISWTHEGSAKPDVVILGVATWSIKLHGGRSETLQQYKVNVTAIGIHLERLAEHGEVYWVLQDPVNEEVLSKDRKMITNQQLEKYNEVAVDALGGSKRLDSSRVKLMSAKRQAALETIGQTSDGLHMPESTVDVSKLLNREQTDEWKGWMQLVILIYHVSGASAFVPVYMHVRVLVAAYLFQTGYGHFSFFWLKGDFGLYRVCQVLFRLNFLVLILCVVMDRPYQFYYFVPLVTFWFVVIYGTLAMWPQILQKRANTSGMWHLGVLAKLLGLLVFISVFAYSQGFFDSIFSVWPLSKLFELNGSIHEWWFRWKLDRFAVIHGMLFALIYLLLQKRQVLFEGKGETLFSARISNLLLFFSVITFITYSVWASKCKKKSECNEMHPYVSVVQILAFILIRNIPGYARSVYSSFFAWFGKISLELFICQYHIWLAADTKGILILIPGNPSLNIMVSSFIFVCVAHEISLITNDLAQVVIPKDTVALLKRVGAVGVLALLVQMMTRDSSPAHGT